MSISIPKESEAILVHAFGGNDALTVTNIPVREPGEGEVLVRIEGAGVNPVDWKIVRGYLKAFYPTELPFIPGWELSGTVVARGHAARRFSVGDTVYGYARRPVIKDGVYARYQIIPEPYLARAPASIPLAHAGGVPLAALTAHQSLHDVMRIAAGETLLVLGASGGVGAFAVQLGKIAGLRVVAVASRRNLEFLRSLGADEVAAYDEGDASAPLPIAAGSVDVIFDCVGGPTVPRASGALRAGGRAVSITQRAAPAGFAAESWGYHFVEPNAPQLEKLATLIDEKKLAVHVSETLPLREAAKAHAQSEAGHTRGKIVLLPSG
jgi:NADPH:quinone reductase-like Zn-dependent oxidoreductase